MIKPSPLASCGSALALWALAGLAGLAGMSVVSPASANVAAITTDPRDERSLADLVAALGSDSFSERDGASREIENRTDLTCKDLEVFLRRTDLSPEQRARVLSATRQRFMISQRAALGVEFDTFNGNIPARSSVIRRVIPGFPSAAVLQPGDEIIMIDGEQVDNGVGWTGSTNPVRPYIISADPGDSLSVTIVRRPRPPAPPAQPAGAVPEPVRPQQLPIQPNNQPQQQLVQPGPAVDLGPGEKMELKVPLGRYADLQNVNRFGANVVSEDDLREAWRVRERRLAMPAPAPIASPIKPDQIGMPGNSLLERENVLADGIRNGNLISVNPGGEPLPGRVADADHISQAQRNANRGRRMANGMNINNNQVIINNGQGNVQIQVWQGNAQPQVVMPGMPNMDAMNELMQIETQILQLRAQADMLEMEAQLNQLPAEDRQALAEKAKMLRTQIDTLTVRGKSLRQDLLRPQVVKP